MPSLDSLIARLAAAGWMRFGTATLGVASLAAGGVAVFVTDNGNGSAALVGAGVVLSIVAGMGSRLTSIEAFGVKAELAEASEQVRRAAYVAEAAGDPEVAERLHAEADHLMALAGSFADRYEEVRRQPPGRDRTRAMSAILHEAETVVSEMDPERVRALFETGEDGKRVIALRAARGNPALAHVSFVTEAIESPRSAYELWQALNAAKGMPVVPLGAHEASRLREARRRIEGDPMIEPHNRQLARAVLERLDGR